MSDKVNKLGEGINGAISDKIIVLKPVLAPLTTDLQYSKQPELEEKYGAIARARCQEEVEQYLDNLAAAVLAGMPVIFANFMDWSNKLHLARNVPTSVLIDNLECMTEAIRRHLPTDMQPLVINEYIAAGLAVLNSKD